MNDHVVKHLELIQNIITRMNTNSFMIKGWTVTIVSALLALYASSKNANFVLVGIVPNLIFWFLDSFYLQQERKFRGLYDDVAGITDAPKKLRIFEMRPDLYVGVEYSFWNVFKSETIAPIYLGITILLSFVIIYHCIC